MNRAAISASGSETANERQRAIVEHWLTVQGTGPDNAKGAAEWAQRTGIAGRTVRAAYSSLDGESFVLGHNERGVFVATTPEQAAALDAELLSKLRSLARRLRARRAWWKRQSQVTQLGFSDLMQRESA